ncbi:chloroplast envelope quinone oxidoreductase homolog [Bidens hawaiensis]|uniref:chloroplast envelope quinone oxidoreductase homolog n=1 Tax=Bidens hawaiensis TaxID=980011 RepID=UPI00404A5778
MADKFMHAVQYDSYGVADLEHVEVPIPKPCKGEVLIKVEATSINPVDWKVQQGLLRPLFPLKFPCIPATDVAGEVIDVGPGITRFKVGDKVVSMTTIIRNGGLSEYAVGSERMTVLRPPEVSAAEGAGLPIAGLTALQALTYHAGITLDKTTTTTTNILITAASGGVGQYAVQLAKLGNVHVTATCGNHNIDLVKGLGADEVIDYKTSQGEALKSPSGKKYDVVIHCAPSIPWSTFESNLSSNGIVLDVTPVLKTYCSAILKKLTFSKKKLVPVIMYPETKNLEYMVGLVKDGKLKTVIDSKYPLSEAEKAWAKSISGHAIGKIIVEP